MSPDEIEMVRNDLADATQDADGLARSFYATLFEIDPQTRALFDDDMVAQRRKLLDELDALVDLGTSNRLAHFEERAADLGSRHVDYGVEGHHYDSVGVALLAALRAHTLSWDDTHERAWTRLYALVAEVMRSGAAHSPSSG